MKRNLDQLKALLASVLIGVATLAVTATIPSAARAAGNDYPDAATPCEHFPYAASGTGYWCANYDWGPTHTEAYNDPSGNSTRGYGYRNCTDFVAWRISQIFGVDIRGWGNAEHWETAAIDAGYTLDTNPRVGDIAQWDTEAGGGSGHVAYIYDVINGQPRLEEYNHNQDGNYTSDRTGTADHYIHIGDLPANALPEPPPTPAHPAAVLWGNGPNVFIRGGDGNIYGQAWDGTRWTGYTSIGSGMISDPVLLVHNNALNIFARGYDSQIYTKSNNGSGWNSWISLGAKTMRGTPRVIQYGAEIDIFALGADGHPYKNTWQTSTGWGGWTSLGDYMASAPSPVVYGPNLSVVMRGTNNQIYVDTWNGNSWSGFGSIGGTQYGTSGNPKAITNGTQFDIVTDALNQHVYMNTYSGSSWGGWADHGGDLVGDIEVMTYGNDLEFFALGTNQHIYTRWWSSSSQTWGGWYDLGGGNLVGNPAAIQAGTQIDVFALGSDGKTYLNTFNLATGWGGFTPLPL